MSHQDHADRGTITDVLPAVVQIVALRQGFMGNLSSAWTGSGTIVHPAGLVLTNCHVANPRAMGMSAPKADKLAISVTERSDQAPVLTYVADIVGQAPKLDLAVLRIVSRIDGKSLGRISLPYVPIGDSDELELGDILSIFGYPGIGGETVTFTSGSVAGFTQQRDVVNGRAWIKTDATIAGGNSGGTAVDGGGHLVGIPTQAAAGTGISPVDARPVVDTNQDGRIDQRDTPMAIGGFINGLRPVNLAKPLLEKAGMDLSSSHRARSSSSSSSKKSSSAPAPAKPTSSRPAKGKLGKLKSLKSNEKNKPAPKKPTVTNLVFSLSVTKEGLPINPSAILPVGSKQLFAGFEYDGLRNGTKWEQVWTVDGKEVYRDDAKWSDGPRGYKTLAVTSRNKLPEGEYHLILSMRGEIVAEGIVHIGRKVDDSDTEISGQVIDRETKRGVRDALVIALKPGVRTDDFIDKQRQDMAYTSTRTNRTGRFTFPKQLPKGQAYSLIVVAHGYEDMAVESALRISPQAPETAQIHAVPMIPED